MGLLGITLTTKLSFTLACIGPSGLKGFQEMPVYSMDSFCFGITFIGMHSLIVDKDSEEGYLLV